LTDDNALDNLSFDEPSRDDTNRKEGINKVVANLAQRDGIKRPDLEKSVQFRTADASATDVKPDASTTTDAARADGLDSTTSAARTDVNAANKAELSSKTADVRTALQNKVANEDRTKADLASKADSTRFDQKQNQDNAGRADGDANRVQDTRKKTAERRAPIQIEITRKDTEFLLGAGSEDDLLGQGFEELDVQGRNKTRPPNDRQCKQYDLRKCASVRGCFVTKRRECWSYLDHPKQPRTDVNRNTTDAKSTVEPSTAVARERLSNQRNNTEPSKTDSTATGSKTIDSTRAPLDSATKESKERTPLDGAKTEARDTAVDTTRDTTNVDTTKDTTAAATKPQEEPKPVEPVKDRYEEPVIKPITEQIKEALKEPENIQIEPKKSPEQTIAPAIDVFKAFQDF